MVDRGAGALPDSADVVVIGGGIAGASAAYALSDRCDVVLVEREPQLAHHTTGRSAAIYAEHYGGPLNQRLTVASRNFFHEPPADLVDAPLLTPMRFVYFARPGEEELLELEYQAVRQLAEVELLQPAGVLEHAPVLRPDHVALGMLEPGAREIDVMGLHQAFVRGASQRGATIAREAGVTVIESGATSGRRWRVSTDAGAIAADAIVNAAGAWGDEVGALCRAEPLGLTPLRRTAFTAPAPPEAADGPMLATIGPGFYLKPEAGDQVLCSPADEIPSPPCDAKPDELDVARAIDAINAATTLDIRHVRTAWAGLRTFSPDRQPVLGWDDEVEGFCWMVGQGGAGIQTAPAAGQAIAAVVTGADLPPALTAAGLTKAALAPRR